MPLIRTLIDKAATRLGFERRDLTVDRKLLDLARGLGNATGIAVTPESALGLTSVFAAINVLATDVAALPLKVYRRKPDGSREVISDHPVAELLSVSPDGETTSIRWRQALMGHVLGWGNGFAEISFRADGKPGGLYLLDPQTVTPARTKSTNALYYDIGEGRTLYPSRTIHVAGLGFDGLTGYSPIARARQAIALGQALETFGASFFGNGSRPGGVLEVTGKLDADAIDRLRKSFEAFHRGADNAGRIALLEQGTAFKPISIPPEDAQFIASRQFQVIEVARLFNVPPTRLMDFSEAHYNNVVESNLAYLSSSLTPWLEQVEQELNRKLFTPEERRAGFYIEHVVEGLLRGDAQGRAEFYAKLFSLGAISPNEIRARENLPPIEGGDAHLVPANFMTLAQAIAATAA